MKRLKNITPQTWEILADMVLGAMVFAGFLLLVQPTTRHAVALVIFCVICVFAGVMSEREERSDDDA